MCWKMFWEPLAAISQFVEAIAVSFALVYAWYQIRAMNREQRLGAIWEIYKELDSSEARRARRYVYDNKATYQALATGELELRGLSWEARCNAEQVSSTFNKMGYAVCKKLIPAHLLVDAYGVIIARCWTALEPFVQSVRVCRTEKDYHRYFECLARKAIKSAGEEVTFQMY